MSKLSSNWDELKAWPKSIISMDRSEFLYPENTSDLYLGNDAAAEVYHPCMSGELAR